MKLNLINFGTHKQLEVVLDNFQIFTGTNGSGKSTIFHSINWLISGGSNKMITTGEKYCKVSLTIGDTTYAREADGDKYKVYKNDEVICTTKDSFEKLGIDLKIEYLSQFDKVFLLAETPKDKSDILNQMFEIEELEIGSSKIKKDIKEIKKEVEDIEFNIASNSDRLTLVKIIEELSSTHKYYNEKLAKLTDIEKLLSQQINLPNYITMEISTKVISKLSILNNKIKEIVDIPTKIEQSIDCTMLNKLKLLNEKFNAIEGTEKLQQESDDIKIKLKGVECPLCKAKM